MLNISATSRMWVFRWQFDAKNDLIWIPSWWRFNAPENPNQLKGALADLAEIPHSRLVQQFGRHIVHLPSHLRETFTQTFRERLGKGSGTRLAIQEQEQEQEDLAFERFIQPYPRKEGIEPARQAWKKLPSTDQAAAIDGVHRHLETKAWQDGIASGDLRFIPLPKTFLRDRRWRDEVTPAACVDDDWPDSTAWHCDECGEIHEGTRAQRATGWCPKRVATTTSDGETRCH